MYTIIYNYTKKKSVRCLTITVLCDMKPHNGNLKEIFYVDFISLSEALKKLHILRHCTGCPIIIDPTSSVYKMVIFGAL